MNVVTDACSIINLTNVGALPAILGLQRCRLAIPPIVLSECNIQAAAEVVAAKEQNLLDYVDDDDIPAERYLELLSETGLGEGETECIAVAEQQECIVCCDDRKGRRIATAMFGQPRVIGTLRLLRWCVEEATLNCEEAYELFQRMQEAGGFLPHTEHEFFCSVTDE